MATRPRQPGSAFKPFVYATAFKKGYTPETVLFDVPTEFNPQCNSDGTPGPAIKEEKECYHPQNYDGKFRGPVTLHQALAQSLNLPSVKLLYLAGTDDSIKTAQDLGIKTLTDPDRYGLSLVLGGAEVTLLEMTSAFAVFAQDGILRPAAAIVRIESAKGVVLEGKKEVSLPVLDTEVARTINAILSDNDARVPVFSPQSSLYFPGRPVAAKTGTTQDFRDAWVIGYTPSLVAGVWVGNSDNAAMNQSSISIMVAGPLWHNFLNFALGNTPPEEFIKPAERRAEKPILRGLYRAGEIVPVDKISKKRATSYTPPEFIEEIGLGAISTILAHLRKDDPQGDPPQNPSGDPQFNNWQAGIEKWLSQNPLFPPAVPKEFDDIHSPEKRPKINFLEYDKTYISAAVKSAFPLREVSLLIDDGLRGSKTAPILSENIRFELDGELSAGMHRVKITAYDAVGNRESAEKELLVTSN